MTDPIKPEALRLADTPFALRDGRWNFDADDELRRLHAEVKRLREALTGIIKYAKGVHDPHLEELVRDFLKEAK